MEGEKHVFRREACVHCGKCCEECYSGALERAGREMSADEVMAEVLKDKIFYDNSHGGMTLSGGEPMAQFAFTKQLLELAKQNGVHTCLETCGFAKWERFEEILPLVDIFLYDVKATDPEKHREFTGVDNLLIRENLRKIALHGGSIVLRCPLVPGVNASQEHLKGIPVLANELNELAPGAVTEINVEPYHPLGINKCARLGIPTPLDKEDFTPEETTQFWIQTIQKETPVLVRKG